MVKSVPITDEQFRIGVGVAGIALVAGIAAVRFGGGVSLPAKSPPPADPLGTSSELLTRSVASPAVYQDFLARDAAAAGVPVPTMDEMSRKLPYRIDGERRVLEVGRAPIEVAGVRLRAVHREDALALEIANGTNADLAYEVVTVPVPAGNCTGATAVPFNAMTVARGRSETRVECVWRTGIALAVLRVETLEVPPLSAWYLSFVPPSVVGIDARVARAHLPPDTGERCRLVVPQALRSGLERGEIGWRDLMDFYARHRCQSYQFPLTYRAFRTDAERIVPVAPAGM
jgi:hypothetical protein